MKIFFDGRENIILSCLLSEPDQLSSGASCSFLFLLYFCLEEVGERLTMDRKAREIRKILEDPQGVDLWRLRELALTEGGLLDGT